MLKNLLYRLCHGLLVLIALSLLTFLMADLAPGDFSAEMRLDPRVTAEDLATLQARYGLDAPITERYRRWMASVLTGEFGFSFAYNMPVGPLLWPRLLNTLLLTFLATGLGWLLALPLGIYSAARQGGILDRFCLAASGLLQSVPELLVGLSCLLIAARFDAFPTGGMRSPHFADLSPLQQGLDLLRHLLLPVLALALCGLPPLFHHIRAAMVDALKAPFLRSALGYGISRRRLLFSYALPAAANPLISLSGLSIAGLLSASLLIEVILGWPGLGPLLVEAIHARDLHVVVATILCSGTFLLLGNLLADSLLLIADPRIRTINTSPQWSRSRSGEPYSGEPERSGETQ